VRQRVRTALLRRVSASPGGRTLRACIPATVRKWRV
jgi:hypothetical protein